MDKTFPNSFVMKLNHFQNTVLKEKEQIDYHIKI